MSTKALTIDEVGWCEGINIIPSPNYDERPDNSTINLLVLHHISLPPRHFGGGEVAALFTNTLDTSIHPSFADLAFLTLSAHFFVRRDGEIIQFVSCEKRAWHAGVSRWRGRSTCNDFSIGIELEGHEYTPYTEEQYVKLEQLIQSLKQRYPLQAIVGHEDIAPERKTDPGPFFDWERINLL